jgi:hypothetical protein
MTNQIESSDSFKQYVIAYTAHYNNKKLQKALELYQLVISKYPGTKKAEYSRQQILDIIHGVVPNPKLTDTQVTRATKHFKQDVGKASADAAHPTE